MGVSKTSDYIKIKIMIPKLSQEPSASAKATNQNLKDMDILFTFKMKIESWKSEYECTKINDHIQIKIKLPIPGRNLQSPPKPQTRT